VKGWKFELLNKPGGDLSGLMTLSAEQVNDIYSGINLDEDKRNAYVGNQRISDSGVANYILIADNANSTQNIIDMLIPISEYTHMKPNVYFACKALNYRTFSEKYDGNRPLAVNINWFVSDGRLNYRFDFNNPLVIGGNTAAASLMDSFKKLGLRTTRDINARNVTDIKIIHS